MRDRLRAGMALGVSGALLAASAGCSALLGSAAPVTPPTSAAAPSFPVPVLTVATPRPRSAAPALKSTGTAWPSILASLAGYGQWLLANPDPSLVGNVATPGCATYNLISSQVTGLFRDQAQLKPSAPVFGPVTGPSPAAGATMAALGNEVTLDVTASRPAEAVISRNRGIQVSAFDALPQSALRITLYRGADQRWRFCTVDALPGTAADGPVPLL